MDVKKVKNKNKHSFLKKVWFALISLIILVYIMQKEWLSNVSVMRDEIIVATVKKGDLDVSIEGYGTLQSNKLQLLTSLTRATVKEIVLKPGAIVNKESIIVRMENPELLQQVNNEIQQLAQSKANLRQLKINQQREALNELASITEITANYESAKLRRKAEEALVKDGIISQLDFQQTLLTEQQLSKRIEILTQRVEQLKSVHLEAVNIQQERIKQQQGLVNVAQNRLDRLDVKAGFDGVLQRLSVELGESLAPGQEIALIGSVTDLIAMIRIPQNQAQQVGIGQVVIIDTRRDEIIGTVGRIDPIVVDNTVNIEVTLPKNLPASARPESSVDGIVIAETLKNITYIERPANVRANASEGIFMVDDLGENAYLKDVIFGRRAGRYIEITSGAKVDQKLILSDLAILDKTTTQFSIKS